MAVPSSGQLSMIGLAREKKYDDYNSTSAVSAPISLYDLFIGGNTKGSGESYDTTNILSTQYPKPVTESEFIQGTDMPMNMSEWRGYDHDIGDSCSNYTSITLYKQISQDCSTAKPGTTYYINNSTWSSATALLRDSGSGNCISALAGWYYCASCSQNGTELREWNGSAFINTTGCP